MLCREAKYAAHPKMYMIEIISRPTNQLNVRKVLEKHCFCDITNRYKYLARAVARTLLKNTMNVGLQLQPAISVKLDVA